MVGGWNNFMHYYTSNYEGVKHIEQRRGNVILTDPDDTHAENDVHRIEFEAATDTNGHKLWNGYIPPYTDVRICMCMCCV